MQDCLSPSRFKRCNEKPKRNREVTLKKRLIDIYKEYNPEVDKKLFAVLMGMYVKNNDKNLMAPQLLNWVDKTNGNFEKLADMIYDE